MKRCFGYVRVSTTKQGEGVSLDAQKEAILAFADSHDIHISKWFEETVTAAKSGRPIFGSMVKALKRGDVDGVVMHKIDRSARNFFDWAKIGELSDAGVDVHFAAESLDFRSRGGRLAANVQMAVAEDYCRNLREEVRKGQGGCLKQGLYPFKAPIGYIDNGKRALKTIDTARAPFIKEAFELYASGQYSTRSLRLELNQRGLRNGSGNPISKGCLEKFLRNPFYTGIIKIRRTGAVYQGRHEPLISAQVFDAVQRVRAEKSGKKVTRHNHTYRGLFKCATCANAMIPERQKGYVYYRCHTPTCRANCVREEQLEAAISQTLSDIKLSDRVIEHLTLAVKRWGQTAAPKDTTKTHAMQLAKNASRLETLTDALLDEIIDSDTYAKRKERLLLEQARLRETQRKSQKTRAHTVMLWKFLERLKTLAQHYNFADPLEKRQIAEATTSNRSVAAKNVYLEPANWLRSAEDAIAVFSCADARTTSRTSHECIDQTVEVLIKVIQSDETARFFNTFMESYEISAFGIEASTPRKSESRQKAPDWKSNNDKS